MKLWLMLLFVTLGATGAIEQEVPCVREDLEICTHKLERLDILDDVYDGSQLCEVRIETRDCFVNYTNVCADGEAEAVIEEEYITDLQTNITRECVFVSRSDEVQQVFDCLGAVETHAEECVDEVAKSIYMLLMQSGDADSFTENRLKCLALDGMIECVCDRIRQCSTEEIADAARQEIREELKNLLDACEIGEDIAPLLETED